jgi:cysteine desulfurase/selenocysteine lyase
VPHAKPGDEILLTIAEHYSNLLPWREAAARTGAVVRTVDVDDEGRLRLDDLDRKLSSRTRIVAVSHVSNVLGAINPIAEVCARARHAGARVLVDAAQSVPHIPVDVRALGCDFLAFSSHKMLGPMGIGVLWARRERLDEMTPYQTGSNMAHDVEADSAAYEHGALKFGAGTPNVSGPVGLAAAIGYLDDVGRATIRDHEQRLTTHALERLSAIRGLRVLGPRNAVDRLPVFTFALDGRTPADIVRALDAEGIAIRGGDMAALPLLHRLGIRAAARASCYLYTTAAEIDRLADVLERVQNGR